ncbi:hypothetical protein [Streptomyces sp. NPDC058623]|uniref:hypothetical protein n=1 Tax=Streptomyces sp. NPDC058623 TaxID=3346563 RepID=UPI00364C7080
MIMHLAAVLGSSTAKDEAPVSVLVPSTMLVLIGLVLALLAGLGAGVLHRGDHPPVTPPLAPQRYGVPASIIRGFNTALASAGPILAALIAHNHQRTVLVLLLAAGAGIVHGLVHRSDGASPRASIGHGWTGFLTVAALGQAITMTLALA